MGAWPLTAAVAAGLGLLGIANGLRTRQGWRESRRRLNRLLAPRERHPAPRLSLAALFRRWQRTDAAAALHLRWEEFWGINAVVLLVGGVAGFAVRGVIGGVLLGTAALGASLYLARWRREQWLRQAEAQLPDLLRGVATALKAGSSLAQALTTVGAELADPLGAEIRRLARREALGFSLSDTLTELSQRVPSRDLEIAIAAIQVQRDVGGALAPLLERVVETVEARQRLKNEVRVLTAMGRASGIILTLLPIGLGLLVWFMNPAYMDLLFTTGTGHILLIYAIGSLAIGAVVMNRMVRGPEL
jgi:tight adherence protein B